MEKGHDARIIISVNLASTTLHTENSRELIDLARKLTERGLLIRAIKQVALLKNSFASQVDWKDKRVFSNDVDLKDIKFEVEYLVSGEWNRFKINFVSDFDNTGYENS